MDYNGQKRISNLEKAKMLLVLRWLVCPVVYIIFGWYSFSHKENFTRLLPKTFFNERMNKTVSEHLIPVPETLSKSWALGRLQYKYEDILNANLTNKTEEINKVLNQSAYLLGRPNLSEEEFNKVYTALLEREKEVSTASKIIGFFNFVNLMWLAAIIGILVTIGPCIAICIMPIMESVTYLARMIAEYVIVPCHQYGIFEILAYFLCILFITDGYRYNQEVGFYVALLGILGFAPCFFYSTALFYPFPPGSKETSIQFTSTVLLIALLPYTLYYQSYMLAWIMVILLFTCLGFSVATYGLCICIGFESDEAMFRCFLSSFFMQTIFVVLKITGVSGYYLQIFQQPFNVMGSIILFICLLIMSSAWFSFKRSDGYSRSNDYLARQLLMIVFLFAYLFIGFVYGINGVKNTAITFMVLYIMEKYTELHFDKGFNIVILVFLFSVSAYLISLYLYAHKEFIVSLFDY